MIALLWGSFLSYTMMVLTSPVGPENVYWYAVAPNWRKAGVNTTESFYPLTTIMAHIYETSYTLSDFEGIAKGRPDIIKRANTLVRGKVVMYTND